MAERGYDLGDYSDAQLEEGLVGLVSGGRRTEALLVAHLGEVEARKLHLKAGAASMFAYCLARLGLSEMEAFYRIAAARLSRRYPQILGMLARGELHLSGLCAIRNFVNDENHVDLLAEIAGKSKRQIELALARRFPRADVSTTLVRLHRLTPLAEDRYALELTIGQSLKDKLERAQELMSHANPSGDLALVIERGMDLLLGKLEARRLGVVKVARPVPKTEGPNAPMDAPRRRQHIPNAVRRAVVERDGASCSYVGADGTRCGARAFLQLHHELAWAAGGEDSVQNLRPLCAAHNRLLAEEEATARGPR